MKYVLDTNALSALMKGDAQALAQLRRAGRAEVGLPQPVIAEISYGLERLPKSKRRQALQGSLPPTWSTWCAFRG